MKIREAVIGDIKAMHPIRMAVKENRLNNPDLVQPSDYVAMLAEHGRGWVCEADTGLLGFAIVDVTKSNVWALFVSPEHEKKGVGMQLHDAMLQWYFTHHTRPLWLTTAPNTRAEKFYEKAGWLRAGFVNGEIKFVREKF